MCISLSRIIELSLRIIQFLVVAVWTDQATYIRGGTGLIQMVGLFLKIIAYMAPLDPKLIRTFRKSGGALPSLPALPLCIDLNFVGCSSGQALCELTCTLLSVLSPVITIVLQ